MKKNKKEIIGDLWVGLLCSLECLWVLFRYPLSLFWIVLVVAISEPLLIKKLCREIQGKCDDMPSPVKKGGLLEHGSGCGNRGKREFHRQTISHGFWFFLRLVFPFRWEIIGKLEQKKNSGQCHVTVVGGKGFANKSKGQKKTRGLKSFRTANSIWLGLRSTPRGWGVRGSGLSGLQRVGCPRRSPARKHTAPLGAGTRSGGQVLVRRPPAGRLQHAWLLLATKWACGSSQLLISPRATQSHGCWGEGLGAQGCGKNLVGFRMMEI